MAGSTELSSKWIVIIEGGFSLEMACLN